MSQTQISLRPETADDFEFIKELVIAIRESEPGFCLLLAGERTRILEEQADLQRRHYQKVYPSAHFTIIEANGKPIGRYYVHQASDHFLVVELSLLPNFQRFGIGAQLIRSTQAEAIRVGKPVRLSVQLGNPATSFYQKLSFQTGAKTATHQTLIWTP